MVSFHEGFVHNFCNSQSSSIEHRKNNTTVRLSDFTESKIFFNRCLLPNSVRVHSTVQFSVSDINISSITCKY